MNFKTGVKYFFEIICRIFIIALPFILCGLIRLITPLFFYQNKKWLMPVVIVIQFSWLIIYSAVAVASMEEEKKEDLLKKKENFFK